MSLGAVTAAALAGYYYADPILRFLIEPVSPEIGGVYFFSPAEAFLAKIKIAFFTGLIVAFPIIATQVWLFVSPALYKKEKKIIFPLAGMTSALFLSGAAFSFFAVTPFALKFLVGMRTEFLRPMISVSEYVNFLSGMMLAFGVAFNLPIFVLALVFSGVIDVRGLNRYQRHAIVTIFILAALLTPGPDIASQLILAVPLIALYELSILAAWILRK